MKAQVLITVRVLSVLGLLSQGGRAVYYLFVCLRQDMNSTGLVFYWCAGCSKVTSPMLTLEAVSQHFCLTKFM